MALKTNFTDDILAESMNGKRQYNVTENSNGTKSLEDVTNYQSVGSTFSAKDMNETNAAVNQAYDDIGDEFNPEVDYAVGDYAIRNNKVWKFTAAHPAGAWDESHVKETKILSEARELTENFLRQIWKKLETSKSSISIPTDLDYSELAIYISGGGIVGEIHVVKEYLSNVGKLFRCGSGFITGVAENVLINANVSLSTVTGTIYVRDSVISSETTIFYR